MFKFKQFTVQQSGSAMKVGTDGVLIGAWSRNSNIPVRILDIGTGTGLIALILAQRNSLGIVDAVELDRQSVSQAEENFKDSPWGDRLNVYHSSIQDFANHTNNRYNIIVSNPPFFTNSLTCPDSKRSLARHDDSLPMDELMSTAARLLTEYGWLSVIVPFDQYLKAIDCASVANLHPTRVCNVFPTINSAEPKRVMVEFTFNAPTPQQTTLTIELGKRMEYSEEYRQLTSDFYLKF